MTYEEEILAANSTSSLQRNVLPRSTKKQNMEFDENYRYMTRKERDEFLDKLYPQEPPLEPPAPSKPKPKPIKEASMNFADELKELIDKWRDQPGYALQELVDVLENEVEILVEEVNARV